MNKPAYVSLLAALATAAQCLACDDSHNVGAPCHPDKNAISETTSLILSCTDQSDENYLCEESFDPPPEFSDIGAEVTYKVEKRCDKCDGDDCVDQTVTFVDPPERSPIIYGFCSCACKDSEGKGPADNDALCECPPTTVCASIGYDSPSYCIPDCMAWGCLDPSEICTPPVRDEEPWMWSCMDISG